MTLSSRGCKTSRPRLLSTPLLTVRVKVGPLRNENCLHQTGPCPLFHTYLDISTSYVQKLIMEKAKVNDSQRNERDLLPSLAIQSQEAVATHASTFCVFCTFVRMYESSVSLPSSPIHIYSHSHGYLLGSSRILQSMHLYCLSSTEG